MSIRILLLICLSIPSYSCSNINKAFFETKRIDTSLYKKYAAQLVKDIKEHPELPVTRETQAYLELSEVNVYFVQRKKLLHDLQGIGRYCRALISIVNKKTEESEKILEYQALLNKVIKKDNTLKLADKLLADFNAKVKESEALLDAFELALPILNVLADSAKEKVGYTNKVLDNALVAVQNLIEESFNESNNFFSTSMKKRQLLSKNLDLILKYRWDTGLNKKLIFDEKTIRVFKVNKSNLSSRKYINQIEKEFAGRLSFNTNILRALEVEKKMYQSQIRNLAARRKASKELLAKLNQALILWHGNNKKLAAGVTDKAEIFDLLNPSAELNEITKSAISKISIF